MVASSDSGVWASVEPAVTSGRAGLPALGRSVSGRALAVFLPLCIAYAATLNWIVSRWLMPDSYWSHGILLPFVAAAVVFSRRKDWGLRPACVDHAGLWLLVPGLLLHLCGAALMVDSVSAASLLLSVPGAAWWVFGRERLRGLWSVFGLLCFAIPMPIFVSGRLAFELKEAAIGGSLVVAQSAGVGVAREGASLLIAGQEQVLRVADPCSGLRSLLALMTLGYCLAFFMGSQRGIRRWVLLVVAAPTAFLANVVRIASICFLAERYGVHWAATTGHDVVTIVAWIFDLGVLLLVDKLLSRRHASEVADQVQAAAATPRTSGQQVEGTRLPRGTAIALSVFGLLTLMLALYRPFEVSAGRAAALPHQLNGWSVGEDFAIDERTAALLGTDDCIWRRYEATQSATAEATNPVFVVAVFHGSNWKSVHPPEICLRGSNMDILEHSVLKDPMTVNGDSVVSGRYVTVSREDGQKYVSLYLYGAEGLHTPDYSSFFMHHAPRAILRSASPGYLLRVETWVDGEDIAAGESRCRAVMQQLLQSADAQLLVATEPVTEAR